MISSIHTVSDTDHAPARNQRGTDHIYRAPEVPAPLPIRLPHSFKRTLLLVPMSFAVLRTPHDCERFRPDVRAWIQEFMKSRKGSPAARASKAEVNAVPEFDFSRLKRLMREGHVPEADFFHDRAGFHVRTATAKRILSTEANACRAALRHAAEECGVGGSQMLRAYESSLTLSHLEAEPGVRVVVDADEYIRVASLAHDEVVIITSEARAVHARRRWGRNEFTKIVVFPD